MQRQRTLCVNCTDQQAYHDSRCIACYWWRRRHNGQERPEEQIVRHNRRRFDRSLITAARSR